MKKEEIEQHMAGQSISQLSMLVIQFVLGMILNLFVTLPANHPGQSGNYFVRSGHSFDWSMAIGGGVVLFLHVIMAILLLVGAIYFVYRAISYKSLKWIWLSSIGLLGIIVAFTNGLSFLDFNSDISSFIMAMGFLLAGVVYLAGFLPHKTDK